MSSMYDLKRGAGCGMSAYDKKRAAFMSGGTAPTPQKTIKITDWENVRSNRIESDKIDYDGFTSIKVKIIGTDDIDFNFVGYDDGGNIIVDMYWFESGRTIEIADTSIKKWNLWLKMHSDSSYDTKDISPSDVTSCTCTLFE